MLFPAQYQLSQLPQILSHKRQGPSDHLTENQREAPYIYCRAILFSAQEEFQGGRGGAAIECAQLITTYLSAEPTVHRFDVPFMIKAPVWLRVPLDPAPLGLVLHSVY